MKRREEFEQCETLKDYLRDFAIPALWHRLKRARNSVAMDMGLSQSELTRKLSNNPNDKRNFSLDDLESYIATQRDLSPIYYLYEKYATTQDKEARKRELLAELAALEGRT